MLDAHLHRSLFLATIAFCWCARCESQDSPPPASAAPSSPCVLLTNGNVLQGTAQQLGEWVLIRNGEGNESRLPRQSVACWADSVEDLYQFRVDRRRSGDIEALLADARWCQHHDLIHLAAEAIREIYRTDPANAQAQLIETQLRRRVAPPDAPRATVPSIQTAAHEAEVEVEVEGALVDLKSLRRFGSQVQPMLVNRCGQCHSEPCELAWSLVLPPHGARPSSRMTRENLQNSLTFLSAEDPDRSALLTKALSAHGGAKPPLDPRDAKAIEALRGWIHEAASSLIHSAAEPDDASPMTPDFLSEPGRVETASFTAPLPLPPRADAASSATLDRRGPNATPTASRLPEVANPFDPEIFNRRFHLAKPTTAGN